jgi:hypothetical protein
VPEDEGSTSNWVPATPRQRYSTRGRGLFGGTHRGGDDEASDTTDSGYDSEESEEDATDSEEATTDTAPRGRRGTFGQPLDEGVVYELEEPDSGDETDGTVQEIEEPVDDTETKEQESEEGAAF